jgi:hypothetical protein
MHSNIKTSRHHRFNETRIAPPPLFKRYIGGGRATSATVSPFTHSSAPGKPAGDYVDAPPLAIETRFARRTTSRKYTRYLKRTSSNSRCLS